MKIVPISLRKANDFVAEHHRHNGRTSRNGGKFALSLEHDEKLIGVAIVGRPISATFNQIEKYGHVAEVLRTCVLPDSPKGSVSCLYGACWRAWRAMGGTRLLTYTLSEESGASLRGAGWTCVAEVRPTEVGWRKNDHLTNGFLFDMRKYEPRAMPKDKYRWEVVSSPSVHGE